MLNRNDVLMNLVPSLSKRLLQTFDIFHVMHHGTHEKQISNVFAWLLSSEANHGLGMMFQNVLVDCLNDKASTDCLIPYEHYTVMQEVDTARSEPDKKDVADIVLSSAGHTIVIENYESSDGHHHDYNRYFEYGKANGRQCIVVLLCSRHEPSRQRDGWEQALVLTYEELLGSLKAELAKEPSWKKNHADVYWFVKQIFRHFLGDKKKMSTAERISFIKSMCDTGESWRYGKRPHEHVAIEFAEEIARHAEFQFKEGRATLSEIKKTLKNYAANVLMVQINEWANAELIGSVKANFVGRWEWCVTLCPAHEGVNVYLEFGPTVVEENMRLQDKIPSPNYSKLFVTRQARDHDGIDKALQTNVSLEEVLLGLNTNDLRLRDAVIDIIGQG